MCVCVCVFGGEARYGTPPPPSTAPTALCEYVNKVNHFLIPGSLYISIVWQRYQLHARLPQANNAKLNIVMATDEFSLENAK